MIELVSTCSECGHDLEATGVVIDGIAEGLCSQYEEDHGSQRFENLDQAAVKDLDYSCEPA